MLEDDLWWTTTFGGRRPLVEDHLRWKTPFGGRQPSVEDDLQWKTTFCGRQPLLEDDLHWKTTFRGSRWILASCLLCFAAFFKSRQFSVESSHSQNLGSHPWNLLYLVCPCGKTLGSKPRPRVTDQYSSKNFDMTPSLVDQKTQILSHLCQTL